MGVMCKRAEEKKHTPRKTSNIILPFNHKHPSSQYTFIMAESTTTSSNNTTTMITSSSTTTNNNNTDYNDTATLFMTLAGKKLRSKHGATFNESAAIGPNEYGRKQLEKLGWTVGTGLGKHRTGIHNHIRVIKKDDEHGGIGHNKYQHHHHHHHQQSSLSAPTTTTTIVDNHRDQWWKSSVGNTLARLKQKKEEKKRKKEEKKKKKKKKKEESSSSSSISEDDNEKKNDEKTKKKKKKRKRDDIDSGNNDNTTTRQVKIMTDEELFVATGGVRFGMRAQTPQRGKWKRTEHDVSTEDIQRAIQQTEWDGLSAPRIILDATTKATLSSTSSSSRRAVTSSTTTMTTTTDGREHTSNASVQSGTSSLPFGESHTDENDDTEKEQNQPKLKKVKTDVVVVEKVSDVSNSDIIPSEESGGTSSSKKKDKKEKKEKRDKKDKKKEKKLTKDKKLKKDSTGNKST